MTEAASSRLLRSNLMDSIFLALLLTEEFFNADFLGLRSGGETSGTEYADVALMFATCGDVAAAAAAGGV